MSNTNNEASTEQTIQATFEVNVVPSKISQLENDMNYITDSDIPTKVSQLENDVPYMVKEDIPRKTSELINNSGYITEKDIPKNLSDYNNDVPFVVGEELPTKVSQLENDAGYVTEDDIKNLDSNNFKQEILENTNKLDYSTPDSEFKFVSENYVQSFVPYMGRTKNSEPIDIMEDLYNLEEDLRTGKAVQAQLNSCITTNANVDLNYASSGYLQFKILHPSIDNSKNFTKDISYNLNINGNGDTIYSTKGQSYLHILRRYHILTSTSNASYGLDITNYNTNTRNYIQAFTHKNINWFIPTIMYEVQLIVYNENKERLYSKLFYTFNSGIKGEEFTELEVYDTWKFISDIQNIQNFIDTEFYEVKYTGKQFNLWLNLSTGNYDPNYKVSTIEDQNSEYKYKEILPTYFINNWCQKCHDTAGNVAYADLNFESPNNSLGTTCYTNIPDTQVSADINLYKEVSLDTKVSNTGEYIWDWECYRTRYPEKDKMDIAFYVYGIINPLLDDEDPNKHFWTNIEGSLGSTYEGTAAREFEDFKTPDSQIELTQKWYKTNKENLYVLDSDVTEAVVIGEQVPEGTKLYFNKSIFNYSEMNADGSTLFESDVAELAYEYTDEKVFLYDFMDYSGSESFFEGTPGIYEKQENGSYQRIDEAYQWECDNVFNVINPSSVDDYIVFPAEQNVDQFDIDWSINGLYWWVFKAWKVVSNETRIEAWCPFDYSLDTGKIDILCMDSEGNMITPPEGEYWLWEGTFNPNFANRLS